MATDLYKSYLSGENLENRRVIALDTKFVKVVLESLFPAPINQSVLGLLKS